MGETGESVVGEPATAGGVYLAEASRLLADSLDYETTLSTVAALALPHLGGWCIVDLVEEDGTMRRLAVIHPEPDKQSLARSLASGWPPELEDPLGVPVVVRTGRPVMISHVSDELVEAAAREPKTVEILRELGIGSVITVPMVARGHVVGAMTFVSPHGHSYDDADLRLAEDLGRRAGISIDNARLFRAHERARAQAEEASRTKSEFLAAMSHEMRTPLNAVLGYVDLLEVEIAGPLTEEQRAQLERIRAASAHLLGMVDQVLDLARLDSRNLPVGHERGSVQEAVDEALARARPAAGEAGVELASTCPDDRPAFYMGDVGRVGEVLDHLLSNAVKFSRSGGAVRVGCGIAGRAADRARLSGRGPWACVEVEDAGRGIDPGRLDEMFEPFRQGTSGYTKREEGAGLGLTVARHLARLMGGDVTVRSEPGAGSCFTLWLPAAPDSEPDPGRDERGRRRSGAAVQAAGRRLACTVDPVMDAYVRRIRTDPQLSRGTSVTDVDLLDHAATLVSDVAQSMVVLGGSAEDASRLLRDGSRIQRLVSELHGEQRRRLGWSEAELRRDFEILREEVEGAVRAAGPDREASEAAAAVAARLLRQGERVSVQAYRALPAEPAAAVRGNNGGGRRDDGRGPG